MTDEEIDEDLQAARKALLKAAELKDVTQMWYLVRDVLNLLTMILNPEPVILTDESVEALTREQAQPLPPQPQLSEEKPRPTE